MRFLPLALLLWAGPAWAQVPRLGKIVVVVMENQDYDDVRTQPYTAGFIAAGSQCSDAHGVARPSQPNYLALWCGSTLGVTSNDCPAPGSPYLVENLGHACEAAGLSWRAYSENLPEPGSPVCTWDGSLYTRKHCPWTQYGNLDHAFERPFTQLALDLANDSLPNLSFVIPNNCNNSHDGGASCGIPHGDSWLAAHVPALLNEVGPNGVVVITYDEGNPADPSNHMLTAFRGARVKVGVTVSRRVNHYNLLRTLCDALGLAPFGAAIDSSAIDEIWLPPVVAREDGPSSAGLRVEALYPNPSNGTVRARLVLSTPSRVHASVYSVAGSVVAALSDRQGEGAIDLEWDGLTARGPAAPGVYYLRVATQAEMLWRRFVLVR